MRSLWRQARDAWQDAVDLLRGRRDALTPPRRMMRVVGGGDFKEVGEAFLQYVIAAARLQPSERVLDVGCGVGRMAIPLTRYLSDGGSYDGFDVDAEAIRWCQRAITRRYPHFRFQFVDLHNRAYNPRGSRGAADFRFPYESECFDLVFLTSVFTHMLPPDVEHYVCEVERVLRREGRCLASFFLMNEESLRHVEAGESRLDFRHRLGNHRTVDPATPEAAVGYAEGFVLDLYAKHGLRVIHPIHYGSWCGRAKRAGGQDTYQDVILAARE